MARVLIACEESQAVCKEFRRIGHEAYSCDIQECSGGHPEWHIHGDVLEQLDKGWDMMIGHPPCTYLSHAGNGYFNVEKYGKKAHERVMHRLEAAIFFYKMWMAPIDMICLENPVGFMNHWLPPQQVIEPYFFGDRDRKKTCLWLKGLPALVHSKESTLFEQKTHVQVSPTYIDKSGKPRYFTDSISGDSKNYAQRHSPVLPAQWRSNGVIYFKT